jgi:hypothetical protein
MARYRLRGLRRMSDVTSSPGGHSNPWGRRPDPALHSRLRPLTGEGQPSFCQPTLKFGSDMLDPRYVLWRRGLGMRADPFVAAEQHSRHGRRPKRRGQTALIAVNVLAPLQDCRGVVDCHGVGLMHEESSSRSIPVLDWDGVRIRPPSCRFRLTRRWRPHSGTDVGAHEPGTAVLFHRIARDWRCEELVP